MPNSSEQNHANYTSTENNFLIIVIGVSVKELDVLNQFFNYFPGNCNAAFIIDIANLETSNSFMAASLIEHTNLPVYWAEAGRELQVNSIYLVPDSQIMTVKHNTICLAEFNPDQEHQGELSLPLNSLFNSVAHSYQEQVIGIILSNLEHNDGVQGLTTIQAQGGIALIKEALNPVFQDLIRSQITNHLNRASLPVPELAQRIYQCIQEKLRSSKPQSITTNSLNHHALRRITNIFLEQENLDFSYYQPKIISQHINHRLIITKLSRVEKYIELLETSAEERKILSADLGIKRTNFFDNAPAWLELEHHILPKLIKQAQPDDELRFWVAACATGQEAYSLAMLVHEAIQLSNKSLAIKIFATDIVRVFLKLAVLVWFH